MTLIPGDGATGDQGSENRSTRQRWLYGARDLSSQRPSCAATRGVTQSNEIGETITLHARLPAREFPAAVMYIAIIADVRPDGNAVNYRSSRP